MKKVKKGKRCVKRTLPTIKPLKAVKRRPVMATSKKASTPKNKRVTFQIHADPGSTVYIAGDFNAWDAQATLLTDPAGTGDFSVVMSLPPGAHEYKFVIDGTWCVDPNCNDWVQNNLGTLNSVCKV